MLEVENTNPPGHPANPMTDEDTANKLRLMGEPLIGAERCNEVSRRGARCSTRPTLRPTHSHDGFLAALLPVRRVGVVVTGQRLDAANPCARLGK